MMQTVMARRALERGIAWLQTVMAIAALGVFGWIAYVQGQRSERVAWQAQELERQRESKDRFAKAVEERDLASRYAVRIGETLSAAQTDIDTARQETAYALRTVTAGRACLSARAVGLLNAQASPARLPAAGEGADRQPLAPDSARVATDTDIAGWINGAIASYNVCRATVICWNAWYDGTECPE